MASVGSVATGPVPTSGADPDPIPALERALRAVVRRQRLQRLLSGAAAGAVAGLAVATVAVVLGKLGDAALARAGFALAALLPLAGAASGALRRVDRLQTARVLDRHLGRSDLIASGWSFARLSPSERSEFMAACIRQAGARALHADPRRALPLRAPRALGPAALLALLVGVLSLLDLSPEPAPAAVRAPRPRLLHHDDLRAFAQQVEPLLESRAVDPLMGEAAEHLNALLEALHEGEIDRAAALAELRALEKKLELARSGEDMEALREALRGLGRTLDRDALTKSVAQAMADGDAAAARAELERLASALQAEPPRADALRRLGKTLERTAAPPAGRDSALKKARDELERLLKKREQQAGRKPDERQDRLLRDKRRELERLQREQQRQQQAERKLDRLRRELSGASAPAQGNRAGETGRQLQRAAEELAQAQREQLTAEQREQLRERLAQLRELISKQKAQQQQQQAQRGGGRPQGGQAQRLDLDRFVGLSRGQGDESQDGQGGQQPGKAQGKLLVPGGGGEPEARLLLPGQGEASPQPGDEQRAIADTRAGEGGRVETGERTRLSGTRVDTRVQGAQGQGATRSEVIREAGQRGFVTRGYERVHTDYERHAEAVLERDRVPGGYRFYVRRYFQLIRPREGGP